jgi:hypothetical protein
MRLEHLVLAVGIALSSFGVEPGIPGQWRLGQNQPDPFCSTPSGWATQFGFDLTQKCLVSFIVWDESMGLPLRTLVAGEWREAGCYTMWWDGLSDVGVALADGMYPYTLVASDSLSQVLFADTLYAHVSCGVGTRATSWGSIKAGRAR